MFRVSGSVMDVCVTFSFLKKNPTLTEGLCWTVQSLWLSCITSEQNSPLWVLSRSL